MTPLIVFALAALVTFAVTPLLIRLAPRIGAVDRPRSRHQHRAPTAKLGGLALAAGFGVAVAASFFLPVRRDDPQEIVRLAGLALAALVVLALGLLDDMRELPAWPQFAAQVVAAVIVIAFRVRIDDLTTPFGAATVLPEWLAVLFTLFWVVGMMNTVNFLDGLDGLAAGVVGIACVVLFLHTRSLGQESVALLPLALVGAIVGFLPFNFSPARIFLGSAGALFLGLSLGSLSIIGGAKLATALLVLGIPILDTAWQIARRVRDGRAPYHGDRGHLHFRLVDRGIGSRRVVLALYMLTAVFGGMALVLPSGLLKLAALALMGTLMFGLMLWLTRAP
ncbi:MAG: undecaprenyl/decaprenyl-phosphate alpha-N-acetylglucosaminyl 1-phosphate transferase [Chloroflexi bacterium]|nr:undecaprenyl/decaprenyl-phosphate alpha-N-acetylglucosaminyl 1-phosphate transferase [Chloroflexota bacterium]